MNKENIGCVPCMYKQMLDKQKKEYLTQTAKERAKQTNEYYSIIYDSEDKKYSIKKYEDAKASTESIEIIDTISPY